MFNRRRSLIVIPLFVCAFFLLTRIGSTHEPITTKVMFNKEVIRILERNCLGCHAPGKIKEDIPLTTYDEARPWAKAIKEEILEKRMMPFQSVKGYGRFQHDYVLKQRDTELLISWIEGGAPRGEAKDYPQHDIDHLLKNDVWPLGQPGLVLQPKTETKIEAESDGEVKCVALPTNLKEDRWLNAVDFQPGNGSIVYRATFAIEKATAKTTNNNGKSCIANAEKIGDWVPGQSAARLPQGIGQLLPANSRVVMQIHYRTNGEAATDRSRLALYFAKYKTSKSIHNVAISPATTTVPANEGNHRVRASLTFNEATEAVAIRPLLFPFAKSVEATVYRPDGTIEVLIVARGYRYDWQPAYYFNKPVHLPRGTRIEVTAYLDNSDNNRNNPNDTPVALKFAEPLCEITLAQADQIRRARKVKSSGG